MLRRTAPVLLTTAALLLAGTGTAHATVSANGRLCTKVGTPGNDLLIGTAGNDVLCGLGGNDVLRGGAGSDTLDGGAGIDRISGDAGSDVVIAGTGDDRVDGGDGNDRIDGGAGRDTLAGGGGNDTVLGGADGDTLTGGLGTDSLQGGGGNDDLDGGGGSDVVAGGDGTNWCTVDSTDRSRQQCVYDVQAPVVVSGATTPTSVDVTDRSATVSYSVHLTDDTGLLGVSAVLGGGHSYPLLVSGSVRDGWWKGTASVPRFAPEGPLTLEVDLVDRVRHTAYREFAAAVTVVDRTPDLANAVLTAMSLSTQTVDTRTSSASTTVVASVADDASGVAQVIACPSHQFADAWRPAGACTSLVPLDGTSQKGRWKATVSLPQGSYAGDWSMDIWTTDRVHQGVYDYWYGPQAYASATARGTDPMLHEIPNGAGPFTVLGVSDVEPPVLESVTMTPAQVDTLPGAATVSVDIATTDDAGVKSVGFFVSGPLGAPSESTLVWTELDAPTSGTRTNGVWHVDAVLPQGTPVGTYYIQVMVQDLTHAPSWVSASSPHLGQNGFVALTAAQTPGTDGTIQVIQHPTG